MKLSYEWLESDEEWRNRCETFDKDRKREKEFILGQIEIYNKKFNDKLILIIK